MNVWLELARVHAPLIIVVAPLAAAAIAAGFGFSRFGWAVALVGAVIAAASALDLGARWLLAGSPPPLVIEGVALAPDGLGVFAACVVACMSAAAIIAAGALLEATDARVNAIKMALALALAAGWSGALLAGDLIALVASVHIGWIASIGLVALGGERERAALSGAMQMLSAGAAASVLLFAGVGLLARATGSFELAALENARIAAPGLAAIGVGLMFSGLAIMAAAAPLHIWAPAALGRAGALAALLLGAVGMVGALAAFMRIAAHAIAAPALGDGVAAGLSVLGFASVAIGSVQAIGARNLPRLAGYAAAAQAGCIIISMSLGSPAGIAAALVQLLALAAAGLALLGGAAAAGGARSFSALDGLGRRAPLASVALTAGALSLMGAPLTIGFLGRWRMIEAAVGVGWWWAACAAIFASLAGVFYGGRLIERVYFRHANAVSAEPVRGWRPEFMPALLLAVLATAWGLEPSVLLRAAASAAALMTGGAP